MEPSKEAIAVRITRLNRQILGKVTSGTSKLKKAIDRETLLDALTVLYNECNDDPVKKCDELVKAFVDKYRSTLAELRRTRVCLSDFEILQTIGRGHYGEVHMVREKQTSDVYALKSVRKEGCARGAGGDEREVLAAATAPWMPRLQYAFQDSSNLYLVMELCSGGDLAGLLSRRNHPLSERDAAFYVAEVAHALNALHAMGFVHRDVKPHNILLDRCGHVKLGDFGSCARLSDGSCAAVAVGTPDYVAPELLAAADCAQNHTHTVCLKILPTGISSCDYWSLGVVAFELVTLRRPFSSGDDDSTARILANIQKYERSPGAEPPFEQPPNGPSRSWRALVAGLLRVDAAKRYNYLDTLQHAALAHLPSHHIRDQAPPWVPCTRGAEDASLFAPPPRAAPPPSAAPFRARPPFAGQLPFVGYSYVAPDTNDDTTGGGGFNASHDSTAIDLATFKSAEKLAAMRGREIASLQSKLAAAEAAASAEAEKARRAADAEAEIQRARLQAEITALSLQNRRLERQIEVEKEERMALERTNQQLSTTISDRSNTELRAAQAGAQEARAASAASQQELRRLEAKVAELQAECARSTAIADSAQQQQKHYKDTIAKERALRRQTLSGGEAESREAAARAAAAEANAAREARARAQAEAKLEALKAENTALQAELEDIRREMTKTQEILGERKRLAESTSEQVNEAQTQLALERARVASLKAQVQELERGIEAAGRREASLEEQCARTEARLHERLEGAEHRAAAALQEDARHREKVNTLEQLVRQLEREVSALETRVCPACEARGGGDTGEREGGAHAHSDTESVGDMNTHAKTQVQVLKEQLERAEGQLQARADEIANLRQEARTANLARWRKEREYNELQVEAKGTARELKRLEERLAIALEARKTAEQKANTLQSEIVTLRPQHEQASKQVERLKEQLDKIKKAYDTAQAEVDRSRNDIRKLKSELQYSERRRLHAEEEEELSSRERAQMRDELTALRNVNQDLVQNNKALQEACTLLEEQLTDLEKLADLHEIKNKDLEAESVRMRSELSACREKLQSAERAAMERGAAAQCAQLRHEEARENAHHAFCQLQLLRERLESREARVSELETRVSDLEGARSSAEAALSAAARRVRELQEECATLRTKAHHHHATALQLQASLAEAQEEISAVREASEAATAWWRTRETKADATLRQQAKLIDFLQAKVEEANRKKCSFSNKLFGRSSRRAATSPPLRRANRELRDEVDRLRAKLSAHNLKSDSYPPTTPKRDKSSATGGNGKKSLDKTDDGPQENTLLVIWANGVRERMRAARADADSDGALPLVLTQGGAEHRARLLAAHARDLPVNEANRAFTACLENGKEVVIVCGSVSERAAWVSRLTPAPAAAPPAPRAEDPPALLQLASLPHTALHIAPDAVAIGCSDGLHSLRGTVTLEFESEVSPPRRGEDLVAISGSAAASGRALFICSNAAVHGSQLALASVLRRASSLNPNVGVRKIRLPDVTPPHYVKASSSYTSEGPCAVIACGRRVFLLRYDAAVTEFKIVRSLTVDRPTHSVLLTHTALYIAGEKPLKINLPAGALESFGMEEPIIAAAAKKHSPPKAILLIREKPVEILICYAECGVFVDESGRRTRNEDPKWSCAISGWEYVAPFLYLVGDEKVTIIYLTEEAYRAPPCTCDTTSLASSASESYMPEKLNVKIEEPALLGVTPNGIIIRKKEKNEYKICIVEGMAAFRSIGASVESLATVDTKGSSTDLARSLTDLAQSMTDLAQPMCELPQETQMEHEISKESVEVTTGFLADIRKRARQLRKKNRQERTAEDVIKEILTTEVGLTRSSNGRKSPAMISDCESDTESDETDQHDTETASTKRTSDLCAEMFTRQVRFQPFK